VIPLFTYRRCHRTWVFATVRRMNSRLLAVHVMSGIAIGLLVAPGAWAESHQRWSAPKVDDKTRMVAIDAAGDPLLKSVTAKRRQARGEALRLKLRLTRAAKLTIRMHSSGTSWRPLKMRARKGANRIRITGGKDARIPTGRYRLKVSARAGDVVSKTWKLSIRVVPAHAPS
jgi:hypothetical protein